MSRRAISRLGVATLVAAAGLAAGRAGAQVAVFDAGNYTQNLLQAARALTQIANQAAALQNQARMLLNQARNLQPLGASETTAVSADMARVNALARQAGRVADDVAAIRDEFASHYSGQGSDGALAAAADARWRNSLDAFRHVLEVQAAVAGTAAATGAQVGAIAGRGDAAAGALQATQAGDELLAVQAKQLADVTALLAARSRAEALEAAGRAAAAAEGRARLQAFLARGAGS